jgi:hypothetical protein
MLHLTSIEDAERGVRKSTNDQLLHAYRLAYQDAVQRSNFVVAMVLRHRLISLERQPLEIEA